MIADVPIIDIDAFLSDPTSAAARAEVSSFSAASTTIS